MNLDELQKRHCIYSETDKRPRKGCMESGNWTTWECCDFHRRMNQEHAALSSAAIDITKELFPEAIQNPGGIQDGEARRLFSINDQLLTVLSERWWELVNQAQA